LTAHRPPRRPGARIVEIVWALAALVVLAALLGGIPVLLWQLAGWPLPHQLPSLAELRVALTRPLPDEVIANTLVTLAWAWWAHFVVCLVAETVSAVRGRMPVRVPAGWLNQALAARLIGAILLLTPSANLVQPGTLAAPGPVAAVTVTAPTLVQPRLNGAATMHRGDTSVAPHADEQAPAAQRPVLKRYVVQPKRPGRPHDTLWGIAERHLGDPLRWPEIWQLNRGRPLPDPPGGQFTDADRIWPGQDLLLPADAIGVPPAEPHPTPPPAPPQPPGKQQPAPPATQPPPSASTSPSTTAPARPAAPPGQPPTTTPSPAERQGGQLLRIVSGLAGAGLLAVGVLALLTRLRRRQQRARRPGRRIPLPTGTTADVEVGLHTTQEPDTARFLDLALRALAHGARQQGLATVQVQAVLITPDHLQVRLDRPSGQAPAPFEQAAPDRWRLARNTPLDQLEEPAAQAVAPFPALVTIGQLEDTRVMLNLEAASLAALAGDPIQARGLVDAWAVELATSVWSDYLELVLVGFGAELGPLERVRHVATLEEFLPTLQRRLRHAHELLDAEGYASATMARMTSETPDSWTPTIVLCAKPPTPTVLARLTAADLELHRLPVAIVAVGELPPPAWRIELADGHATIDALDLTVRSLQLSAEAYQAITKLLATAASTHDVDPTTPPYDTLHRPTSRPPLRLVRDQDDTPIPAAPTTQTEQELVPAAPVEVRVLGKIDVAGVPRIERTKALELIVYLALHPTGVDMDRLWEALWPQRPLSRATLHTTVSIARSRLGEAPDSTHYLPTIRDGLYRLHPAISVDWTRFQTLTQLAAHDPDRATAALRQALKLVHGLPLESPAPSGYEWAIVHRTEMESAIGEAAEQLARRSLEAHHHADATWAARRGLRASPYDERLYRQLMLAADAAGNPAGVDAVMRELIHVLDAEAEPLDDLHPDTIALYKRLRGTRLLRT
jgi:DNA-binding SARP family transcriptional activator